MVANGRFKGTRQPGEEEQRGQLAERLRHKMDELPAPSSECCIYRVPRWMRQENEKAYQPQMVSIGPLHHANPDLQAMESYKRMYLEDFLGRTRVSLEDLVKCVQQREQRLRKCYSEAITYSSDEFVELMLVDAVFVIEILLRYSFVELRNEDDNIFGKASLIRSLWPDFWLLENQIPLFVVHDLFLIARLNLASDIVFPTIGETRSLIKLIHDFLQFGMVVPGANLERIRSSKIEHLLAFLRLCYLPSPSPSPAPRIFRAVMPSAEELHHAGLKFKKGSSRNTFDMNFNNGILEIPPLTISFRTEFFFRNLVFFEQCHCAENYINDYFIVMDRLINTPEDVDLLAEKEVVEICVGGSEEVATLVNNLGTILTFYPSNFYFSQVCEEVNAYYSKSWHKYEATLRQQYFNTPWAAVSFLAALLLLSLTFIQTVFSIIKK